MPTPTAFLTSWLRARERILARHRALSWRQQKRARGPHTARVRRDYQLMMLNGRVRIEELYPRSEWTAKLIELFALERDHAVVVLIGSPERPVIVGPALDAVQMAKLTAGKLAPREVDWQKARII